MKRGYVGIGLVNPKTEHNIGSVLRAMACFDATFLAIQNKRFKKAATDTNNTYKQKPIFHTKDILDQIPYSCVPVCIEINDKAKCISTYKHPERAFYIFGPEDGSVPTKVVNKCRDVVSIPTEFCLNLAMACLLYTSPSPRDLSTSRMPSSA